MNFDPAISCYPGNTGFSNDPRLSCNRVNSGCYTSDEGIASIESRAAHMNVRFSKEGWRQFRKIDRRFGANIIRAYILKRELAVYIVSYEHSGRHFEDSIALRYDENISVILENMNGCWYITDVETIDPTADYVPVYFWTRIKRDCSIVAARVLIGWRCITCRHEETNHGGAKK